MLSVPIVSVLLYLCSVNAEYSDKAGGAQQPSRPKPRLDKHGRPRIRPPNKPTIWATGTRMGAALDAAQAKASGGAGDSNGRTVMGHIRRAHYHAFWAGPLDGERALRVKWLPPISVNLDDVPEVATVRPINGPEKKP